MNNLLYSMKALSMPAAVAIYQKLLAWMDTLQENVKRYEQSPDYVLNLHIWFHTAVIDLFRPFAGEQPQQKLPAFAADGAAPTAVVAASIKQLKRLVYQYRTHCESDKYSIIWQSGMLYLVNHILQDYSTKEAHFYFLLCMRGYQHLARHMPFVGGVAQSLFAIAMRLGTILPDDARRVLTEVRGENSRTQEFLSAYPGDLQAASTDLPGANLKHLARDFHKLVLETDLETPELTEKPQG
ncbi:hypothetical protein LTR93_011561 [Exophiala xenobiotica]|nr:hypothetical protein LTR93_011561 [Exophiala xenobiotica]